MDIEFNKNEDSMKMAWSQVKRHLEKIYSRRVRRVEADQLPQELAHRQHSSSSAASSRSTSAAVL